MATQPDMRTQTLTSAEKAELWKAALGQTEKYLLLNAVAGHGVELNEDHAAFPVDSATDTRDRRP